MAQRLFEAALQNRLMTLILFVVLIAIGARAMMRLPIDAAPDVTPNVVQVVTDAPGLGPVEVEKLITFPVEVAMRGLTGIKDIRSISRFGLSSVSVYFDESLDIYFVRRLVMERLPAARELIPKDFGAPEMTPVSTTLGEIYQFEVVDPRRSLMDLRSILDWQIAPALKSVPGVVEVNSYGGEMKTYEVQLRPDALVAYRIGLEDVFRALERNNSSAGGGYIVHNGEQQIIQGSGLIRSLADVGNIVVGSRDGVPVYVRNLSTITFAPRVRQGAVTRDGKGETVVGVVMLLIGQNPRTVVDRVKQKLVELQSSLPRGLRVVPFYDRAELVRRTIDTAAHNLAEGALLVSVVLFLFLGDVRASLIVAAVIPLSMLVAFLGMNAAGVSGNLMSLGAIVPSLAIDVDRVAAARYGINVSDVLDTVETVGGKVAGHVLEGDARYFVQVRFAPAARERSDQLADIKVAAPDGALIPLKQLAHFNLNEGPVSIWRQDMHRRITIAANVRGIDLGSFVGHAKAAVQRQIKLPRGWWLEWGGQYENLQRASNRLLVLVPASLLLILVLLYNLFSSMPMALLIFGNILLGASGGILALVLRGLNFSITAGVGFITLFGVSVLNGVVLVSEINRLRESGRPIDAALREGTTERLRPILMASAVALFGFIPMALSHGAGAEVQRPLATVVIGGLLTSAPFTLYVLPVLYGWVARASSSSPNSFVTTDV